jgi:mitotic-spindle organizing protein 1
MPSEPDGKQDKRENAAQARQVIDVFHEISTLLVYSSTT